MNKDHEKTICDRCGEEIYKRNIHAENMHKYDTRDKQSYINSLMKYEGVSEEVATSWANHGLYEVCEEKVRCCPSCGSKLKTWRAKLCTKCGEKFKSEHDG